MLQVHNVRLTQAAMEAFFPSITRAVYRQYAKENRVDQLAERLQGITLENVRLYVGKKVCDVYPARQ